MKWICRYTKDQPNSEALISWGPGKGLWAFSYHRNQHFAQLWLHVWVWVLPSHSSWSDRAQYRQQRVCVCHCVHHYHSLPPVKWLLPSSYGFHSPSGMAWGDVLTPSSSIKLIIPALSWKAADPSQGLGQVILHSPCNVYSCRRSQGILQDSPCK